MSEGAYKILFTAGGSPGMEAIYRLLHKKYELFFADLDVTKISPVILSLIHI